MRTPIGRELRKFFAAETGVLADADYSQIELRVLAHVADDAMLQERTSGRGGTSMPPRLPVCSGCPRKW
ncbi:MAG: DNA polymerase [Oscillospiraceae bacterium]